MWSDRQASIHCSQFPRWKDSCIGSSVQSSVYRKVPEDPQENMKRDIRTQVFSCTGTKVAGVPESLTPRTALEMRGFPQPMHSSQESGHSRIVIISTGQTGQKQASWWNSSEARDQSRSGVPDLRHSLGLHAERGG